MPDPTKDSYGPNAWKEIEPSSMRGHIVNEHFDALHLANFGVARWDFEIAATRGGPESGFDMDWVVKKVLQLLVRDDSDIKSEIKNFAVQDKLDPEMYRQMLIKNVLYIEELGLSVIDWSEISAAYPFAKSVTLDIEKDGDEKFPLYQPDSH